jgi:hypothetical protein
MAHGRGGYVGVTTIEDGRLDVAAALDPEFVKAAGGLGPAAATILDEAGLLPLPGLASGPWKGTPLLTRRTPRPAAERLFVLGDAAGYVEPFTGEGIGWALTAAVAVTDLAVRAVHSWQSALANEWSNCYRKSIAQRQRTCRLLARVLRSTMATKALVGTLSWVPGLARPVMSRIGSAERTGR